ncbi:MULTISPECIES: dihydrofolate reductase [Weeksella]|uniref:Dihydrofolate reductase n=1 Tax=Weeksella virosa (strain ATCC 43766 / DSM 16922 / JCM 21250 / CCUG 30538 / CDC 9751 / IAM 14551 / NBRC 16016 / NCTC 11634 / CL345/78) TaxID=865938 RepID=F0P011_WEEVC|nr:MULTISPECIES: dihydrofolate reductase [Weeksella]ADX67358.1 Dihydrofolate reductase [Weeksella virosa DSM 16922]MDK7374413.1 dihydrofolate reductase [Weeksella virosa]MDK7675639.1 dihydrofolate reductase [Weeksella virosa]OFM81803.1 dihydrofolate reductase [Weeksella sp. HMSC059D05]VEH62905.1 Dihydrofolate reductase [Weeksella virosa]
MLHLVVAIASNHAIGKGNQMLWHLPKDFLHFKKITTGHPIIMGRKTFESIGRPLPNRVNIVISRDRNYSADGIQVVHSLREAIEKGYKLDEDLYVIGGGEIYRQAMEFADKIYLTEVHHEFEGDTFFPEIDDEKWVEVDREHHLKDDKHLYSYDFVEYLRR